MTLDEAAKILLTGVCGPNALEIARETGIPRNTVSRYLEGADAHDGTRYKIYTFIWRRINAHLLISEADRACETCRPVDISKIA